MLEATLPSRELDHPPLTMHRWHDLTGPVNFVVTPHHYLEQLQRYCQSVPASTPLPVC